MPDSPDKKPALSLWFVKAGPPMAEVKLRTDITAHEAVARAVRALKERDEAQRRRRKTPSR